MEVGIGKHKVGNGGLYLEVALASARCRRRAAIIRALKALVAPFDVDNLQKGVICMNATSALLRQKKGKMHLLRGTVRGSAINVLCTNNQVLSLRNALSKCRVSFFGQKKT